MIVLVDQSGPPVLTEKQDFKGFKVKCTASRHVWSDVQRHLSGIATHVDEDHAWIHEQWLRDQARDEGAAWTAQFDGMYAYARKKGWIDEATGAIRAHIEWPF